MTVKSPKETPGHLQAISLQYISGSCCSIEYSERHVQLYGFQLPDLVSYEKAQTILVFQATGVSDQSHCPPYGEMQCKQWATSISTLKAQ